MTFNAEESNPWLTAGAEQRKGSRKKRTARSEATKVHVDVTGAAEAPKRAEAEEDDEQLRKDAEQAKLMQMAFQDAGIAEQEFIDEQMKALGETEKDDDEPDMPGWGGWAGMGVKEKKRKAATPDEKAARKRAKVPKRRVIISAKRNKKAAAYLTESIPYPFTSKEQYAMSLQNPLGSEWNTARTFKEVIKPRVSTQMGAIIQPIKMTKEASQLAKESTAKAQRRAKKRARLRHQKRRKAISS